MLKFRVWLKEEERIKDVYSINFEEETVQCIENTIFIRTDSFEDVVLMQSTGLCDKRGNEIFEGDITKGTDETTGIIEYNNGVWYVMHESPISNHFLSIAVQYGIEIVGNIHEHDYLLEWR